MDIKSIRQTFFDFFDEKGHQIVPSAPMVVKDDPTLMFTNAGMNQFKDYFLGNSVPKDVRVANTQKCLRVSGKHNDLEEVGVDTYHHTMFEMIGNWSFGDYFKKEAIDWAWELLTEVYKINKDNLYITVYEGDQSDGVDVDQESIDIWKKHVGDDKIILADKKDNFWEMGETGPCGPCSEIHVDIRSADEKAKIPGRDMVNMDHPQVIEIWNLVFMQYNRKANGSLEKLPATHVDTGMGLERLAMVLQGKQSNYDTDLFQTLIQFTSTKSGVAYGKEESTDIALRVVADHVRAIAFSIADGQLPSNTGAGYVIRRILRRAARYAYQTLGMKEPFLHELSAVLVQEMQEPFAQLGKQKELIAKVIKEEEISFLRTLEQGVVRINSIIEKAKSLKNHTIMGQSVFELYDTFGFPVDLTSLIARENDMEIDEDGFNKALKEQKDRSRAATAVSADDWIILRQDDVEEFVGYDRLSTHVYITKYRKVTQKKKEFFQLVFNLTPFYPEGGGQIGDSGFIEFNGEKTSIFSTKKENNLIVHLADKLPADVNAKFDAVVNANKRNLSASNHSATHLLHHALRTVLGEHVEQKGSYVGPDYLRFDFSHFSKVTDEELMQINKLVIKQIKARIDLYEQRNIPIEEAQEQGAMMLFGEKYGDTVRMIQFGDSKELCGGTHVSNTAEIGLFKITSESAVASGIRRIEAITSDVAEKFFIDKLTVLNGVAEVLKNPKDILKTVTDLQTKNAQLQKQIEVLEAAQAGLFKTELAGKIESNNGVNIVYDIAEMNAGNIKDVLFQLKGEHENLVAVIGGKSEGKASLSIMISENLVAEKGWNAGQIIREVSKHIQGGGGGQPFFATAGGKNADGLQNALDAVKAILN